MWIMLAPASTARRASAAYSSGVYGIAGHWSRSATAPEMAHVISTESSRAIGGATLPPARALVIRSPMLPPLRFGPRLPLGPLGLGRAALGATPRQALLDRPHSHGHRAHS